MTDQQKRMTHEKLAKPVATPQDYTSVLDRIKDDVQQAQLRNRARINAAIWMSEIADLSQIAPRP